MKNFLRNNDTTDVPQCAAASQATGISDELIEHCLGEYADVMEWLATPPCYGIFWAISETESELTADNLYCVIEPYMGESDKEIFNHKRHWQTLDRKITHSKPFDYYPRGRVEIRNGKATVWLNDNVLHLADRIIEIYGVKNLPQVRVKVDGSNHYKCHFDK